MKKEQQGDVYLFQTNDNGEICFVDGVVDMRTSLETMAYLCLFGGNEKDDGSDKNKFTWWGNLEESNPSKKYISRTQNILRGLPFSISNLNAVTEAVKNDLKVFVDEGLASEIKVVVTVPKLNFISIKINIISDDSNEELLFSLLWQREVG